MIEDKIKELITEKFPCADIEIINNSTAHAGHSGNPNAQNNTHFELIIDCDILKQYSKVKAHREIYQALDSILHNNPIHALQIKII